MKRSPRLAEALQYINEDIRIHEAWLAYVEGNPEAAAQPVRQVDAVGDGDHHREWIRRLNVVRDVLGVGHD